MREKELIAFEILTSTRLLSHTHTDGRWGCVCVISYRSSQMIPWKLYYTLRELLLLIILIFFFYDPPLTWGGEKKVVFRSGLPGMLSLFPYCIQREYVIFHITPEKHNHPKVSRRQTGHNFSPLSVPAELRAGFSR